MAITPDAKDWTWAARRRTVREPQWDRTGHRSDGSSFTVDSFARYLLHDPIHHLDDVRRGNEMIADSTGG